MITIVASSREHTSHLSSSLRVGLSLPVVTLVLMGETPCAAFGPTDSAAELWLRGGIFPFTVSIAFGTLAKGEWGDLIGCLGKKAR